MNTTSALLVAAALLAFNAFFVAAEFALTGSKRSRIEPLVGASGSARKVLWAIEHLSQMLAAAQLGVTLCSVGLGVLAEPAVAKLLEKPLHAVGLTGPAVHAIAFVVALLLVVGLHVVVGEMVPKSAAVTHPERSAMILVPPLMVFATVFRPVIVALNWCSQLLLRLCGMEPKDEVAAAFTVDEVVSIVEASEAAGVLSDEQGLISGALEFSEHCARDVMVPLDDVASLPVSVTPGELEHAVAETGYSRFVVRDSAGALHGYVHVKDTLGATLAQREMPIPDWKIRALSRVSPEDEVETVLVDMRSSGTHLAAVMENDEAVGVVFLEDILEELVGEVSDIMQRDQRSK
ncbi:HlyC/CorC family transporter [Arcanobacterium haemolyticum]|nr:HlyC/CorC family transporter [Arcanobacterium haemolyticum]